MLDIEHESNKKMYGLRNRLKNHAIQSDDKIHNWVLYSVSLVINGGEKKTSATNTKKKKQMFHIMRKRV